MLFSICHLGCNHKVSFSQSGWAMSNSSGWYLLTYCFRLWRRMLLGIVIPSDLMLLWVKGKESASRIFPITSAVAGVVAVSSTIGFSAGGVEAKSLYPCWYRYGDSQINYDLGLLFVQLMFGIFVFAVLSCTEPFVAYSILVPSKDSSKESSTASTAPSVVGKLKSVHTL